MNLHPKLDADSLFIKDLELCQLRLIPDGENPWFLLIPKRENMREWCDLSREDQHLLSDEIDWLCQKLKSVQPDKLNVASLGNMVPQLHIHVIARYQIDRAWPGPIWGTQANKEFEDSMLERWKSFF